MRIAGDHITIRVEGDPTNWSEILKPQRCKPGSWLRWHAKTVSRKSVLQDGPQTAKNVSDSENRGPLVSWLCSFHLSLSLNAAAASQLWPLQVWGMVRTEQSQVSTVEGLAALIVHTGWKVWAFGGWRWGPKPMPNLPHPWLVFKLSRLSHRVRP